MVGWGIPGIGGICICIDDGGGNVGAGIAADNPGSEKSPGLVVFWALGIGLVVDTAAAAGAPNPGRGIASSMIRSR
jgi:hypothetical protein